MRHASGWIKLHRSAVEGDLGSNPILFALWVALLCMATWKPSKILWQGKQREIPPGTVVFGIKELADRWGCSRSVLRKWLNYLHYTQRIVLESCSRGTLVTICNWTAYQSVDDEPCAPSDSAVRTECAPSVSGEPLSEEGKKEEGKKGEADPRVPALPRLAEIWNLNCKTLARVKGCSSSRRKAAELRWKEMPDENHWAEVVTRIAASPFCTGRNDRGWKATFDFLVRPDTQHKALEGQYDAKRSGINVTPVNPEDL